MPENEVKQTTKDILEQPKATEQEEVQFEDDGTVDFRNINDLIEVLDAEPTSDPVKVSEQVKIFDGILYFYDYVARAWKTATGGWTSLGDVAGQFSLTRDGSWHTLDISSIVPLNTEYIMLGVSTINTSAANKLRFRPFGYSVNITLYNPTATGGSVFGTVGVVDGKIEYNVDNNFTFASLTIRAYQ